MHLLVLSVFLALVPYDVEGARILGMFPIPSKSHMAVNLVLMKELARRGHQVTVFSPFSEESTANFTHFSSKETMEVFLEESGKTNTFDLRDLSPVTTIMFLWHIGNVLCDKTLQQEEVQKLIHSTEKYDLVVLEGFNTDCLVGFGHKFEAPVIQIISYVGNPWMHDWVGNPSPYAYIPDSFQGFGDRMTFLERIYNTLGFTFQYVSRHLFLLPKQQEIMEKYFSAYSPLPSISEMLSSTSLIFINSHFSISYPRPMTPNVVQVGGMHVQPPKKLPADLQKFIDESPDGVIYFSMGSALQMKDMPEDKRKVFCDTFSKLKQRVLWKWETDTLPGKPDNVKIGKWFPQSDILAHKNVLLFITHGGLLSTQETIYRGVPVIGIPLLGDQKLNMAKTAAAGYGIRLDLENITADSLKWALEEILGNPRYREKAKQLSQIFRDQPLTPLEQAVYWTEYVIRHKGALHMRSAALDLAWYQYFLLDVISVLVIALVSVTFISFFVFRLILKKLFSGRKEKIIKKKPD